MTPYLRAELLIRRISAVNITAVFFSVVAALALLAMLIMQPLIQKNQERRSALDAMAAATPAVVAVSDGDQERLNSFRIMLAAPASGGGELSAMFRAASNAQLQIAEAEYKTEVDSSHEFRRLSVSLPVTGSYPQVRSFIFTLLSENPSAALTDVSFKRERPGLNIVSANLRFTLYQRVQ